MIQVQWCQSFYEFAGTVCRYAAKRRLMERICCLPFLYRRTFSSTPHLERKNAAFFINEKQWAYDFIKACGLSESSDGRKVVIFHVNPGNSVLIESLLASCDHQQIAWEPRGLYKEWLESLTEAYKMKFTYCRKAFDRDSQLKILDEVLPDDGTTADATFHAKIVGNVPEMYAFIPKLVMLLNRSSKLRVCRFGIIEPILIVTGSEYRLMTEAEHFWHRTKYVRTTAYELFLRTELLKTVPLSAFNHARSLLCTSALSDYDRENLYIVRLSLREDLDSICSREHVFGLMLLLRMIGRTKNRRLIPSMEHLCPDSGITLLELGISMMDRFDDVPLNMWPKIYSAVTTSSQFCGSPLNHILQRELKNWGCSV